MKPGSKLRRGKMPKQSRKQSANFARVSSHYSLGKMFRIHTRVNLIVALFSTTDNFNPRFVSIVWSRKESSPRTNISKIFKEEQLKNQIEKLIKQKF